MCLILYTYIGTTAVGCSDLLYYNILPMCVCVVKSAFTVLLFSLGHKAFGIYCAFWPTPIIYYTSRIIVYNTLYVYNIIHDTIVVLRNTI